MYIKFHLSLRFWKALMLWPCSSNLFSLLFLFLLHIYFKINYRRIHHHDSLSKNENLERNNEKNTYGKVLGVNRQKGKVESLTLGSTPLDTHCRNDF